MQTITFYAYKGGTGRSLVLANAAKYLTRLGQSVFALDLDLEAPGLHYKLKLGRSDAKPNIGAGLVDCVSEFVERDQVPDDLSAFCYSLTSDEARDGHIWLMPAGNSSTSEYWRKLARINWQEFFYAHGAKGIPFFLDLKARIEKEFNPDFLLIDARTGVTEIGGLATTILPDQVVCMLLSNKENLDGIKEVIRSIKLAERLPGQAPLEVVPVLSRIPSLPRARHRSQREERLRSEIVDYLNSGEQSSISESDLLILHSEESLQAVESLRIGGPESVDDSPLLRDYLRLFSKLIPRDLVEPHLDKLIAATMDGMVDHPDRTQSDLESLAIYCPHPTSYMALLKFYRLRNEAGRKQLRTAARYWELSRDSGEPILWDVIKAEIENLEKNEKSALTDRFDPTEFVFALWNSRGSDDVQVGLWLQRSYLKLHDRIKAVDVSRSLIANVSLGDSDNMEEAVTKAISIFASSELREEAKSLISEFVPLLGERPKFQEAWASQVVSSGDRDSARALLSTKGFRPATLQSTNPRMYTQLLRVAEQREELEAALLAELDRELLRGDMSPDLFNLYNIFQQEGKKQLFIDKVKRALPTRTSQRILEMIA